MSDAPQTDLFGAAITAQSALAKPKKPKKTGHAAPPGSGPAGETCGSCAHRVRARIRSGRVFQKCGLMRHAWTHGPGSDIKAGSPACSRWEAEKP